jgi:hypothetical protein
MFKVIISSAFPLKGVPGSQDFTVSFNETIGIYTFSKMRSFRETKENHSYRRQKL